MPGIRRRGQIRRDAAAADSTYAGAGSLILIKAADWADADDDRDLVLALGVETPETVAADSGFNRWLDRCRPSAQPDLIDLAEAAVVALAEMWPHLARATTYETIQWWLGPDPQADHAPGGPEVRWDSIARSLLAAIDAGPGPDGRAPTPQDLRRGSRDLLADCSREALIEVVQDALFATAQWAQLEPEEIPSAAADMDAVFARAGALWKAVEADLAVAGGWYADLIDCDPEPPDAVRARPALERWVGDARWTDDGAIEYGAAALAIFANDRIDAALGNMTDNEIIDLWALGYLPNQIGPPAPPMATRRTSRSVDRERASGRRLNDTARSKGQRMGRESRGTARTVEGTVTSGRHSELSVSADARNVRRMRKARR